MQHESILIVDDEADARQLLTKVIEKEGLSAVAVDSGERALEVICGQRFAAVLLDYNLPGQDGIATLKAILQADADAKVIMVTSHGSVKLAVQAITLGAVNFLEKPFDLDEVRIACKTALRQYHADRENILLREQVRGQEFVLGRSAAMAEIWKIVERVAQADPPVLIEGETGTGKEVVARAIHRQSKRSKAPFVAVNCAALSRELIESELFGHVKGAFTGAVNTTKGRFEAADGGTLFLDEIGEIDPALQAKLLRVLQEKSFERVGDTATRRVDVRILAATNQNLQDNVKAGRFREDLYYRLNVVSLKIPPLRERREDLIDLIEFYLAKYAVSLGREALALSEEARRFLLSYGFPGNIRELQNILERACLLAKGHEIKLADLSMNTVAAPRSAANVADPTTHETNFAKAKTLFELGHLTRLLSMTRGNISQAAQLAGMDRNNFKEKMRKHGLQWEDFRGEK